MNKKAITKYIIVALLTMTAACANGAVLENAGIIFPELNIAEGARASAMGEAFTAIADDSSAVYWNPAGLPLLRQPEISLTYDKWFTDTYFDNLGAAMPVGVGTAGINLIYLNPGTFVGRDYTGALTGVNINAYLLGVTGAYGAEIIPLNLSLGCAVKVITQETGNGSNTGFAADIGGMIPINEIFRLGIAVRNIGVSGAFTMPIEARVGLAAVNFVNVAGNSLTLSGDYVYDAQDATSINVGGEYKLSDILAARIGYVFRLAETDLCGITGLAAGAGINFSSLSIDYSLATYGDLGLAQRVTATFLFGEPTVRRRAIPIATEAQVACPPKEKAQEEFKEGFWFEQTGDTEKAKTWYIESLNHDDSNAEAWYRLGMIYYAKGDKKAANDCFNNAIRINPEIQNRVKGINLEKEPFTE